MFEKESKDYANKWLEHVKDLELQHKSDDNPEYIRILEAHQKGAEFGYNKANEWHKVLDGDFPKHNNEVLCLLWGGTKEIGCYKNEKWYFEDFTADKDDVDYWQEIKLPKENE